MNNFEDKEMTIIAGLIKRLSSNVVKIFVHRVKMT